MQIGWYIRPDHCGPQNLQAVQGHTMATDLIGQAGLPGGLFLYVCVSVVFFLRGGGGDLPLSIERVTITKNNTIVRPRLSIRCAI